MHRLGHAHSIEAWDGEILAGGVYGVSMGGFFAGESMFHRVRDASKVALAYLIEYLRIRGFVLFDTQVLTEHTARMGATEIPRDDYLRRLKSALDMNVRFI
jgi:leucyl/phenylalanyl-tRNA--protein transferase